MSEYTKPLPYPTIESEPFWEGCKRRELLLPQCRQCRGYWFPPGSTCPHCWSTEWDWTKASGRGRIHSFGVYHRAYHPGFEGEIPYVFAVIQLDEGPRMVSNVVNESPEQARMRPTGGGGVRGRHRGRDALQVHAGRIGAGFKPSPARLYPPVRHTTATLW